MNNKESSDNTFKILQDKLRGVFELETYRIEDVDGLYKSLDSAYVLERSKFDKALINDKIVVPSLKDLTIINERLKGMPKSSSLQKKVSALMDDIMKYKSNPFDLNPIISGVESLTNDLNDFFKSFDKDKISSQTKLEMDGMRMILDKTSRNLKDFKKSAQRNFFDKDGLKRVTHRISSNKVIRNSSPLKKKLKNALKDDKIPSDLKGKLLDSLKINFLITKFSAMANAVSAMIVASSDDNNKDLVSEEEKIRLEQFNDLMKNHGIERLSKSQTWIPSLSFDKIIFNYIDRHNNLLCKLNGLTFGDNNEIIETNITPEEKIDIQKEIDENLDNIRNKIDSFDSAIDKAYYLLTTFDMMPYIDKEKLNKIVNEEKNGNPNAESTTLNKIMGYKNLGGYYPKERKHYEHLITDPEKLALYKKDVAEYDKGLIGFKEKYVTDIQMATFDLQNAYDGSFLRTRHRTGITNDLHNESSSSANMDDSKIQLEKNVEMKFRDDKSSKDSSNKSDNSSSLEQNDTKIKPKLK